jgi:hypothetical protein
MERKKRRERNLRRERRILIQTDGVTATSNTDEESETVDQVMTKNYNVAKVKKLVLPPPHVAQYWVNRDFQV